jgi:hypothetical protein
VTWDQNVVIPGYRAKFSPPHRHTNQRTGTSALGRLAKRRRDGGCSLPTKSRARTFCSLLNRLFFQIESIGVN